MKKVYSILIFVFLISISAKAQNHYKTGNDDHFEMKIWVTHPTSGVQDTIYLGIDTAATEGYDSELEIIDTTEINLNDVGIRLFNSEVQTSYNTGCKGNLKKEYLKLDTNENILNFEFNIKFTSTFPTNNIYDAGSEFPTGCIGVAKLNWEFNDFGIIDTSEWILEHVSFTSQSTEFCQLHLTALEISDLYNNEVQFWSDSSTIHTYNQTGCYPSTVYQDGFKVNISFFKKSFFDSLVNSVGKNKITELKVYPNPSNDILYVNGDIKEKVNLQIIDLNGKIYLNESLNNLKHKSVDISSFSKGNYIIRIFNSTINFKHQFIKE